MHRLNRCLLDPQGGEGGDGTPAPAPTPTPGADDFDVKAAVQGLLAKHGDAERAMGYLLRDNQGYRRRNADLKAKVPPEGAVVLGGDDARAWEEYKALGKAGDLKQALLERDRVKADLDGLRRAEVHTQAAEIYGYEPKVLGRLIEQDKLTLEVKDEQVKGKPARVALVKHRDDQGKDVTSKLPDYAARAWPEFLAALTHKASGPPPGTPLRAPAAGPPPPTRGTTAQLYEGRNPFN